jgi:hypothetical protein
MHDLVVNKTKSLVEGVRFIFLSCDEVATSDIVLDFHSCLCGGRLVVDTFVVFRATCG